MPSGDIGGLEAPSLTERHRSEYSARGFTVVRGALSVRAARVLADEALELSADLSAQGRIHRAVGDIGEFRVDVDLHQRSARFMALSRSDAVLKIARHILGRDAFYFFYDQLFVKLGRTSTRTQWHQDLPFWPVRGEDVPSIWIALTPTDEARSAVQYVTGSHRWGVRFVAVNDEEREGAFRDGLPVCPDFHLDTVYRDRLVTHCLDAGDAVVHHPLVMHGAGPNTVSTPRIAVSLRYCSADTCWDPRPDAMYFAAASEIPAGTPMSEQNIFARCSAVPTLARTQGCAEGPRSTLQLATLRGRLSTVEEC